VQRTSGAAGDRSDLQERDAEQSAAFLINARSKNYGFYAFLLIHIEEIDFAF